MPGDSVGVRDTLYARIIRAIRAQVPAYPLQLTDDLTLRESLISEKTEVCHE
jgi:hypothetical protein